MTRKSKAKLILFTALATIHHFASSQDIGNSVDENAQQKKIMDIELKSIYRLATHTGPATKNIVEEIFKTKLIADCRSYTIERKKIFGCNYTEKSRPGHPINILHFNRTVSNSGSWSVIAWSVNRGICINRNDIALALNGNTREPKEYHFHDFLPGSEEIPVVDYEIDLTPQRREENVARISEINDCATEIVLTLLK